MSIKSPASEFKSTCGLCGSTRGYRRLKRATVIVGALLTLYVLALVYRGSFVVEGQRYYALFDDAMISMCYADNAAAGNGWVWNPGERVEGYTNFGWTALLAGCHLLNLSPQNTCLLVQLLTIPILWGCLATALRLARAARLSPTAGAVVIALVALHYDMIVLTVGGMETGLLCLLVSLGLTECVRALQHRSATTRTLLWFAPAVLVRPDAVLIVGFAFVYLLFFVRAGRIGLIRSLCCVGGVILIHELWRLDYYGCVFPNTYYLKLTGWPLAKRLTAGTLQFILAAISFGLPVCLALAALMRPKLWHGVLLAPFLLMLAYQTYSGGDFMPMNRFLVPTSIGLFTVAAHGVDACIHSLATVPWPKPRIALAHAVAAVSMVVALDLRHWDHLLLLAPIQPRADACMNVLLWRALDKVADPDATVAVNWAGAVPYFSHYHCVDLLGKCDPHIAHMHVVPDNTRPGHNKFDTRYSIEQYCPDVILHVYPFQEPAFKWNYHLRTLEVDGIDVAFSVHNKTYLVHGGTRIQPKLDESLAQLIRPEYP